MWAALVAQARTQTSRAETLPWTLSVVRLSDIEALAMAGGQVLISEYFVEQRLKTDDELAFVLAHEMAHSILEHERQALTYARLLLPRHITRSVQDMYAEIDYNLLLYRAMEPVIQQGEYEATSSACCWPAPRDTHLSGSWHFSTRNVGTRRERRWSRRTPRPARD